MPQPGTRRYCLGECYPDFEHISPSPNSLDVLREDAHPDHTCMTDLTGKKTPAGALRSRRPLDPTPLRRVTCFKERVRKVQVQVQIKIELVRHTRGGANRGLLGKRPMSYTYVEEHNRHCETCLVKKERPRRGYMPS